MASSRQSICFAVSPTQSVGERNIFNIKFKVMVKFEQIDGEVQSQLHIENDK